MKRIYLYLCHCLPFLLMLGGKSLSEEGGDMDFSQSTVQRAPCLQFLNKSNIHGFPPNAKMITITSNQVHTSMSKQNYFDTMKQREANEIRSLIHCIIIIQLIIILHDLPLYLR